MADANAAVTIQQKPLSRAEQLNLVSKLLSLQGQSVAAQIEERIKNGTSLEVKGITFDADVLKDALHLWNTPAVGTPQKLQPQSAASGVLADFIAGKKQRPGVTRARRDACKGGLAAAFAMPQSAQLKATVLRWRDVLLQAAAEPEGVLDALHALDALGTLPSELLLETKIGVAVRSVTKAASVSEEVRGLAQSLVEAWRASHRKNTEGGQKQMEVESDVDSSSSSSSTSSSASASEYVEPEDPLEDERSDAELFNVDIVGDDAQFCAPTLRSSEAESSTDTPPTDPLRQGVHKMLLDALRIAETTQKGDGILGARKLPLPVALASQMEEALFVALGTSKSKYRCQARSIAYNLKDESNTTFGYKVITGRLTPSELPTLSAEVMASDAKAAERKRLRKESAEEIQLDWDLRHGHIKNSQTFQCGKCGSRKMVFMQKQSRSCDEPMTTTVQCVECKKRFRLAG